MSLALDQVRDADHVVSFSPLSLDLPSPHREASGAAAILRRILYRWCTLAGSVRSDPSIGVTRPLLDIDGARLDRIELGTLQGELEAQARAEDFVEGATVDVSLDETTGVLSVVGRIQLVDGRTYALELGPAAEAAAALALLALGVAA